LGRKRFISPDSIVQAPSDPQTLNRYSYTRNNPLRYVDPSGHCFVPPVTPVCAVSGLGLLAAGAIYYATTPPPRIDFLTNPLDVAGPIATHTAGSGPQIDPAPALGYPLGPVRGVGAGSGYLLAGGERRVAAHHAATGQRDAADWRTVDSAG
jgi:hypothetical protein